MPGTIRAWLGDVIGLMALLAIMASVYVAGSMLQDCDIEYATIKDPPRD